MRWSRHWVFGCVSIALGLIILLALILPAGFWWFLLGSALVGFGLWYLRCC